MKIITTILLLCLALNGFAQEIFPKDSTGKIKYTGVVLVEGKTKDELFVKAREWMSESFKSSEKAIDYEDKEAGKLIAKSFFKTYSLEALKDNEFVKKNAFISKEKYEKKELVLVAETRFTINISVKDGKYKYEVKDLYSLGVDVPTVDMNGRPTTVKLPSAGDLSNEKPLCEIHNMMPTIRWNNIRTESDKRIKELIKSLNEYMAKASTTDDF